MHEGHASRICLGPRTHLKLWTAVACATVAW